MTAVDFSWARYTGEQLQAAGVTAVGRYITLAGNGKGITPGELHTFLASGIEVWLNYETGANDATGGANAGTAHARLVNQVLPTLTLPVTTPIYFAVDETITPNAAVAYFQGISAVRPAATNGCYGEGALIDLLVQEGLIAYGWQSGSSSFDGNTHTSPNSAIVQSTEPAPLPTTDLDVVLKADFGQIPRPAPDPPPAPLPLGDTVKAVPFSCQLDVDGNGCVGVNLPTTKTKTSCWVVVDAGSPFDSGWFTATASVDWQPVQAGFCRVVVQAGSAAAGHQVTGRVMVAV